MREPARRAVAAAAALGAGLGVFVADADRAAAGKYGGEGMGEVEVLRFSGSGPFVVGAALASATGGDDSGHTHVALRLGLEIAFFEDPFALPSPIAMGGIDLVIHPGDDAYATLGLAYRHGVGAFLLGGGVGAAIGRGGAAIVSPEVSLPLRVRLGRRLAPTVAPFARLDVAVTGRDDHADLLLAGVALLLP